MHSTYIDVLCSGHFRLPHYEHIKLFEYASLFGSVTVAINGDKWHEKKYGNLAIPVLDRVYVIESCKYVDRVIVFDDETPEGIIEEFRPRYYIKGPDYKNIALPEQKACNLVGTTILFRPGTINYSSSKLSSIC